MNDLIRPTLYEAFMISCRWCSPPRSALRFVADVVGPACESGDDLALDRTSSELKTGDVLAIMTVGRLWRCAGPHLRHAAAGAGGAGEGRL